jgi:hypothetical protein
VLDLLDTTCVDDTLPTDNARDYWYFAFSLLAVIIFWVIDLHS